jgi:hypothetical protein
MSNNIYTAVTLRNIKYICVILDNAKAVFTITTTTTTTTTTTVVLTPEYNKCKIRKSVFSLFDPLN